MATKQTETISGGKALPVEETERGDLILNGYAVVWGGEDRVGDAFAPGALDASIREFLDSQAALLFHHDRKAILGRVLELVPDDYGVKFRARVDASTAEDPALRRIYDGVRRQTINGVSIGGRFTRDYSSGKPVIVRADLTEVSLTAQPMDARPRVLEVEQKAEFAPGSLQGQLVALGRQVELLGVALGSFLRIAAASRR